MVRGGDYMQMGGRFKLRVRGGEGRLKNRNYLLTLVRAQDRMRVMERKKVNGSLQSSTRLTKRALSVTKRNELTRVKRILRRHMPELRERYGVDSLGVFGSFVRGEAKRKSDLDVLVDFRGRGMTLFKFIEMENYLTGLLGVKVDLVMKSALKPTIGKRILEEVVML